MACDTLCGSVSNQKKQSEEIGITPKQLNSTKKAGFRKKTGFFVKQMESVRD